MQFSPDILHEFSHLSVPGVFGIVNSDDRKIDIRHSTNCLEAVVRIFKPLWESPLSSEMGKDLSKLSVFLFDSTDDQVLRYVYHSYWVHAHQKRNWQFYRIYPPLNFKARIDMDLFSIKVKLRNQNKRDIVVGVFDNVFDAESFMEDYYGVTPIHHIVYANNEATRAYFKAHRYSSHLHGSYMRT